ncbi:MAG: pantoate--beta-alanine ligase [Candidatus Omnitrophica bacterium]|nr:pantoate--beta-alanine ligase [Candidatus Omnitrophota bacterium]
MIVTNNIKKIKSILKVQKKENKMIGFVPTMGSLHKGHLSLVKMARSKSDFVVVSIFVNPIQFCQGEDYQNYPKNIKPDINLLREEGVDLIFCPHPRDMYPSDFSVFVDETELSEVLCGKSRSGHFRGVCTVLVKLFNIILPDKVYFGQKDYQQALIVKRLIDNLNYDIRMYYLPTIREKDKLAMSSRNSYLKDNERLDSLCINEALSLGRKLIQQGETRVFVIVDKMKNVIIKKRTAKIVYIEILDAINLKSLKIVKGKILIALAVYINGTRLIDNTVINVK